MTRSARGRRFEIGIGFVLAALLAVGCADSRNGDDNASIAIADLETEVVETLCDVVARCYREGDDANAFRILAQAAGAESCATALRAASGSSLATLVAAVDAGRVRYDGAMARECVRRMRSSCVDLASFTPAISACRGVFEGTLANGAGCDVDEECAGSSLCVRENDTCGGTCQAKKPLGAACQNDRECAVGTSDAVRCLFADTDRPTCVALEVTDDIAEGEPCGELTAVTREHTQRRGRCAAGLYCEGGRGSPGTCRAPVAPGARCESPEQPCLGANYCIESDAGSGTCNPVTVHRHAGELCNPHAWVVCNDLDGLECVDGVCREIGNGAFGARCEQYAPCREGLFCDYTETQTCLRKREVGESCLDDAVCLSGRCALNDRGLATCVAACPER